MIQKMMDLGFSEAYGKPIEVRNTGSGVGIQKVGLYCGEKLVLETSFSVTGNLTQWIYGTRNELKTLRIGE